MFDFLNSRYYTRNRGINLRLPSGYSSLYKSLFTLAASKHWNSLDRPTRALEIFSKFKNIMKNNYDAAQGNFT
jgi:hypothetical protein